MLTIEEKTFRARLLSILGNLVNAVEENNKLLKELNGNLSKHNQEGTEI